MLLSSYVSYRGNGVIGFDEIELALLLSLLRVLRTVADRGGPLTVSVEDSDSSRPWR